MYVVTSIPLVRRTRATLRRAEFGFFGVVVYTRVHTPRRCGAPLRAGVFVFSDFDSRPLRTNCWIVGNRLPLAAGRTAHDNPHQPAVSSGAMATTSAATASPSPSPAAAGSGVGPMFASQAARSSSVSEV